MSSEEKLHYLLCRGRNIVYYFSIDTRPRAQYVHVLRSFRKDLLDLYSEIGLEFLKDLAMVIPAKVKQEECESVIMNIKLLYDDIEQEKKG